MRSAKNIGKQKRILIVVYYVINNVEHYCSGLNIFLINLQTSQTYNGGYCTAQKFGTYRIAIQYCDGSNWLNLQPAGHAEKPKGVSGK